MSAAGALVLHPGEVIWQTCHGVTSTVSPIGQTTLKYVGTSYLTSERIVVIHTGGGRGGMISNPRGAEFPVAMAANARFEQPFFSANYFTASFPGLPQGPFADTNVNLKISFSNGGGAQFATQWANVQARLSVSRSPPSQMVSQLVSQKLSIE